MLTPCTPTFTSFELRYIRNGQVRLSKVLPAAQTITFNARLEILDARSFVDASSPYLLYAIDLNGGEEFIQLVRARMQANGLFTTNVVDAFPNPRMVKSLMKTLQQEFAHVDVWIDQIPEGEQRMTFVLSASDRAIKQDVLQAASGFERQWFRITVPLQNSGTALAELPIFTDDYVPVERLISTLLLTSEGL